MTASWYGYAASRADNEDVRHSAMDLIGIRQILQSQESEGVYHRGTESGAFEAHAEVRNQIVLVLVVVLEARWHQLDRVLCPLRSVCFVSIL